jgi:cytochrome c-type biogenesis protein
MFDVSIPVAFAAGLASFFAPCVVPLLPAYIGYVTGVSLKDLKEKGEKPFRGKVVAASLYYILGFSLIFVLMGTTVASVSGLLKQYDYIIRRVGGFLILVMGLELAGIINLPFLGKTRQFKLPGWSERLGDARAFLVGVVFASAWSPCVGVVLGSILTLAAISGTAAKGAMLLFFYSLGISFPFLVISLTLTSVPGRLRFINKNVERISLFAGLALALIGLLLLTNTYKYFSSWLYEVSNGLGNKVR